MLGVGKKVKLIEEKLETLKMLASGLDDIDALIELIESISVQSCASVPPAPA